MQTRLQEHGRRYPNLMMDAVCNFESPEILGSNDPKLLSYSPGIGGPSVARQAFASLFNAYFQPITKISESHIVLAAGGSYALEALVEQICDPGDAILVMAPYWAGFDISLGIKVPVQLIPVHVPLEKCFDVESVDYYEEAIRAAGPRVKAVLVCNPQNPLGRYYPSKTLKALLRFCEKWDLHYISDEVYALSRHARNDEVVKDDVFHSILSFADVNGKKIHVVYSLSKDFGCSGVRLVLPRSCNFIFGLH
jgi:aspartate/methionine/tyrosine aminotransferase